MTWFSPRPGVKKHFPLVALYQFQVPGHAPHEDYTQFLAELDLVVDIGFKGVKLWNVKGYYDTEILDNVTRDLKVRELVFVLPFSLMPWGYEKQFPYNKSEINEFIDFVGEVSAELKSKDNLLRYAFHYPFDWSNWEEYRKRFDDPEFKLELQRIIDIINQNDGTHPIYMVLEFQPDFNPPYDLSGIEGFGVQPYSLVKDDIHTNRIDEFLNFFENMDKKVYIDECGVQTKAGFGEFAGTVQHGWASDEDRKAKMIDEFADYICERDIVWCYFGLHDHPQSDWGLANLDNSLKKSGEAMKAALHDR